MTGGGGASGAGTLPVLSNSDFEGGGRFPEEMAGTKELEFFTGVFLLFELVARLKRPNMLRFLTGRGGVTVSSSDCFSASLSDLLKRSSRRRLCLDFLANFLQH